MPLQIPLELPCVLLPWYERNKRILPWREDKNPYHIWISEIMLQQTRVEAVKGYYTRFLKKFPDISSLANGDDAILNKMWEGLGYYSRVRNLKKAAKVIMESHGGVFPQEYSEVLALPGIGAYTAGAICSIAFNQLIPAVDGNVLRVVTRLLCDSTPVNSPILKKEVQTALAAIYPQNAGDFTQALMELGATVCGPNRKPDCKACPCSGFCKGYIMGTAETLPVRQPKKTRRKEEKTVLVITCDGYYALEKRPDKGLLAGLWQFPNIDGIRNVNQALREVEKSGLNPKEILYQVEKKHIFTHIEWCMRGVYVEVAEKNGPYTWFHEQQLKQEAALPTAFRQFLIDIKE